MRLLHGVTDFPGAFCLDPGVAFTTCQPPQRFYVFLNGGELDRWADVVVRSVILHELAHVFLEHRADVTGKAYDRQERKACHKARSWGAVTQRASDVLLLPARRADMANELTRALCFDLETICNG
jgi:hypothetical protein